MDKLVIVGKQPLKGPLSISGSKNTSLPMMSAALLADGTSTLRNIPNLRDINTFSHVLRISGASIKYDADLHEMQVDASRIDFPEAPYDLVKKMRASFYMLGALLGRCGEARVSLPGGCAWGPRPVDLHLKGMEAFGADISLERGDVVAKAPGGRLKGGVFSMQPSSVGATINLMLAAVKATGSSKIENAAREPDVAVFGRMLQQMGAQIEGLGTPVIEIQGVDDLQAVTFTNTSDRIELGTFIIAAVVAGTPGEGVRIANAQPGLLGEAFEKALKATGTVYTSGPDYVEVTPPAAIKPVSIKTGPFPDFPTDLQAQWTVLLSQASGNARVIDTIYYDRFKHIPELRRMGVNAIVIGNEVVIEGGCRVQGTQVMSTDLRASVSLVLAGMIADGETHVRRVYHLDRGYENLEGKLYAAGINIRRERYDEFPDPVPIN